MTADELTHLLHQEIPLARALELAVETAENDCVRVRGPLAPNLNLHGSVFAGSIYCFATLAGWCLVHAFCHRHGIPAAVVLRHADIRYLRPLTTAPVAEARLPEPEAVASFLTALLAGKPARMVVPASLAVDGRVAAQFSGEFVALPEARV